MTYSLITDQDEASQAFAAFRDGFACGAKVFPAHTIGFQGGSKQCDVYWHRDLGIWGLFEPTLVKGRFWTCFGTDNPAEHANLNITVEINPPTSGVNLFCAGAFLRNDAGSVYLGHSGKVGGGRKGIGKAAFREFATNREWELIRVSGDRRLEVIVLGQLGSPYLLESIKAFVDEVAEFKRLYAGTAGQRPSKSSGPDHPVANSTSPRRFGKYWPLYEHLVGLETRDWQASFGDIERMLGFSLPKSAYSYPAWWSNGSGMPHSAMWLNAGWRTNDLNLTGKTIHFVRDPTASSSAAATKRVSRVSAPRTGKTTVALPTPGESQKLGLRYQWADIGEVTLDGQSRLVFPGVPAAPGIYRFRIDEDGSKAVYIGETDNLSRRFQHYRTPGPTQPTNIRLNKVFVETLKKGVSIGVDVIVNTAWIQTEQGEEQADLSVKSGRMLFEHAAIFQSRAEQVHIYNR